MKIFFLLFCLVVWGVPLKLVLQEKVNLFFVALLKYAEYFPISSIEIEAFDKKNEEDSFVYLREIYKLIAAQDYFAFKKKFPRANTPIFRFVNLYEEVTNKGRLWDVKQTIDLVELHTQIICSRRVNADIMGNCNIFQLYHFLRSIANPSDLDREFIKAYESSTKISPASTLLQTIFKMRAKVSVFHWQKMVEIWPSFDLRDEDDQVGEIVQNLRDSADSAPWTIKYCCMKIHENIESIRS